MDLILLIVAVLTVAFTVTMIWLYKTTGSAPDELIRCWFLAIGGECGVMGWIKTTKEKQQERRWQLADEQRRKKEQEENE